MKLNIIFFITIILICLYHYFIHNGLEKTFSQTYFDYLSVKRPLFRCNNIDNCSKLNCIGMPSGHAETASVFLFLLYFYKIIPLWICLLFVLLFSIQRIVTDMHTISQVLMGSLLGFIYASLYKYFDLSVIGFIIIFIFGLILTLLCIYKIDKKVNRPIPIWVDKSMYESIKKKQNVPLYIKVGSLYINSVIQNRTFISWTELEKYLDIMIENIRKTGIKYDAVVGIKTGGAIISDYISIKLGLRNYKIKLTQKEYNCNKNSNHTIDDFFNKNILNKKSEYILCEGIKDKLEGKNIILVDEIVSTGKNMEESYNYIKEDKNAYIIYPTCIAFYKWKYKGNLKINQVIDGTIIVWPWGYDN
jgi:hypoxanthine phosphoribosyltransferase